MKQKILAELFSNSKLLSIAKKYASGDDMANDMVNELYLTLHQKEDSFLVGLYERGELFNYCCGILYFSWNSPTSPFFIKFRREKYIPLPTDIRDKQEPQDTFCYAYWLDKIHNKSRHSNLDAFVKYKVFDKYMELRSFRKVGAEFDIPYKTIESIVKSFIKELKDEENISSNK